MGLDLGLERVDLSCEGEGADDGGVTPTGDGVALSRVTLTVRMEAGSTLMVMADTGTPWSSASAAMKSPSCAVAFIWPSACGRRRSGLSEKK